MYSISTILKNSKNPVIPERIRESVRLLINFGRYAPINFDNTEAVHALSDLSRLLIGEELEGRKENLLEVPEDNFMHDPGAILMRTFAEGMESNLENENLGRKKKAIKKLSPKLNKKLFEKYPELLDGLQDEDMLLLFSLPIPRDSLLFINQHLWISTGISYFIINELKKAGKTKELQALLPDVEYDPSLADAAVCVNYYNCFSEDSMLSSLDSLLCPGGSNFDLYYPMGSFVYKRDDKNNRKKCDKDSQNLAEILDLIPEDVIKEAKEEFTEKLIEILGALSKEYNRILKREKKAFKGALQTVSAIVPEQKSAPVPFAVLSKKADMQTKYSVESMQMYQENVSTAFSSAVNIIDIQQERLYLLMVSSIFNDKNPRDFSHITFENPYKILFALYYLYITDDDLSWLSGLVVRLARLAGEALPWGTPIYSEEKHSLRGARFANIMQDSDEATDYAVPYDARYSITNVSDEFPESMNIAQAVYTLSGNVIYQNLPHYEAVKKLVDTIDGDKDVLLAALATSVLESHKASWTSKEFFAEQVFHQTEQKCRDEIAEEYKKDLENKDSEIENLKKKLEAAETENRRITATTDEIQKEYDDQARSMAKIKKELDAEVTGNLDMKRELSELRTFVYEHNNLSDESDDENEEVSVTFPIETDKNIVIVGGHDKWVNRMKKLVPDARFYAKEASIEKEYISNADVLWVQTNAVCHPTYYAAVNNADASNVPVHLFNYSSPAKCAEQIALKLIENES